MNEKKIMESFIGKYAKYYDLFYRDKDYGKECDFLEKLFGLFSKIKVKSILDLGCGTGNHSLVLAQRGYNITGVDSSKDMIRYARKKTDEKGLNISYVVENFQNLNLRKKFDIAICMFNSIDYVIKQEELKEMLSNVNKHLKKEGLFIFDFRNAIASKEFYSPERQIVIEEKGRKIIRVSKSKFNRNKNIFHTNYDCTVTEGDKVIDQFKNLNIVRSFFTDEMKKYVENGGFGIVKMFPFLDLEGKIKDDTWNICVIAKK